MSLCDAPQDQISPRLCQLLSGSCHLQAEATLPESCLLGNSTGLVLLRNHRSLNSGEDRQAHRSGFTTK